jgi:6-pyruvoyltetrahydropterin/6-carboxytetrahydropterin synthase
MDFGGLKAFKEWSEWQFDHTLCVASDDPHLPFFKQMNDIVTIDGTNNPNSSVPNERGALCDLRIVEAVGCEKFAELAYTTMKEILESYQDGGSWTHPDGRVFEARYPVGQGVRLRSAEVFEHDGNSAIYEG